MTSEAEREAIESGTHVDFLRREYLHRAEKAERELHQMHEILRCAYELADYVRHKSNKHTTEVNLIKAIDRSRIA